MSNVAFRQKVRSFAREVTERPEAAARAIALQLLRSVVLLSPVDTGRFRGNWSVQFDANPQQPAGVDPSGDATITRGEATLGEFKLGVMPSIFILNHLPYSSPLEYGHSKQAPEGMVRITVQEFQRLWREVARELTSE